MSKLTEEQEKQLYKLLTQTPHDAEKWDALVKSGATDKDLRATLASIIGRNGRNSSSGKVIVFVKNLKNVPALWFGSHAVGVPTLKGEELVREIREVFRIVSPETKAAVAAGSPEAVTALISGKPNGLAQIPLFDYSDLDAETAGEVQDHAARIKNSLGTIKINAVEVGERLTKVKEHLGRGQFDRWLTAEFGMSRDSAERFIDSAALVAGNPELKANLDKFDRSAVYVLAQPSTPEPAVQEATARAKAGERITPTKARDIKKRHGGTSKPAPAKKSTPERIVEATEVAVGEQAWFDATILIQIKFLPDDGDERGRPVQILVRNDNDKPIQVFSLGNEIQGGDLNTLRTSDLPAFKGPVGEAIKRLRAEMPERVARLQARKKAEAAKARKAKKAPAPARKSFPKPKKKGGKR